MERRSYLIVAKELLANKAVSVTARLLYAQLLDYRNNRTGQCNPWETKLARDVGVSRWTVIRKLRELEKAGLIEVKAGQRGNWYEFPKLQPATPQVANCHSAELQVATSGPAGPLYEPSLRNNARAPKRAAGSLLKQNSSSAAAVPRKPATSAVLESYYAEERRKAGK